MSSSRAAGSRRRPEGKNVMTTKYHVYWRAVKTDATGQCESIFDIRRLAQRKADTLNAAWQGDIIHWVEPVEVKEDNDGSH
jgi:hypothetical protein